MIGDALRKDRNFTWVVEGNKQQQFCTERYVQDCMQLQKLQKNKETNNRNWSMKLTKIMILMKITKKIFECNGMLCERVERPQRK